MAVILLSFKPEVNANILRHYIDEPGKEVNTYIEYVKVIFGVSSISQKLKNLSEVYKEAQEALQIGRLISGGGLSTISMSLELISY